MQVHGLDPKRTTIRELGAWLDAVERRNEEGGQGQQHTQHHQPQPNPNMR